jgi:hypothetical protein
LVIAVFVKPLITGQPVNTGILLNPAPTIAPLSGSSSQINSSSVVTTTIPAPTPTPPQTPTPVPTWEGQAKGVEFVDPSAYGISLNQSLPGGTRIENIPQNTSTTVYATVSGKYSGTTQVISVPFPYWELWYTADPAGAMAGKDLTLTQSKITGPLESGAKESGATHSVIQGSFSVTVPSLTIQVMDANDPNRIVRIITPPGGLDEDLWTGKTVTGDYSGSMTIPDPRPWKEKFYEGQRNYFFIINSHSLDSYSLEIRIPTRYVGQY